MPAKSHYVLMEKIGEGPSFAKCGCDIWLCQWSDQDHYLTTFLEQVDIGKPVTVKFTILEMDDDELEEFIRENEIDWEW